MKTQLRIGFISGVLLTAVLLTAATSSLLMLKNELMKGVEQEDPALLKQARTRLLNTSVARDKEFLRQYYIALADYNLINLFHSQKDSAERYLDDAIEHLKLCVDLNPDFAEAYALLSSCYGRKIGFHPFSGIYLGPRGGVALGKALQLEPDNPRIQLLAGINLIFTPRLFGGGKDKARAHLKKAMHLFRTYQPPDSLYPDWGKRDVYGWLAYLALDADSLQIAESYCQQALRISPNYKFVRKYLLPEIEKQKNNMAENTR